MPEEFSNPIDLADQWIEQLSRAGIGDSDWLEAINALHALGDYIIPKLIAAFGDSSSTVRNGVSKALLRKGPRIVGDLIAAMEHEDVSVRTQAMYILYGVAAKKEMQIVDILPTLIKALEDPSGRVREWAAKSLSHYNGNAEAAIPALICSLKDADSTVREWAAMALELIEPPAEAAIPALTEALLDDDPDARNAASEAIDRIQQKLQK